MNMNTAAKTWNVHTEINTAKIKELICNDFRKTKKWSSSLAAVHVTTFAEGLIVHVHDRRNLCKDAHVGERTFEDNYIGDHNIASSEQYLCM